jgi:hypothetical protein
MFTPCIIIGAMIRRDAPEFLDWMEMEPPISESFGALTEPILLSGCWSEQRTGGIVPHSTVISS